MLWPGLSWAEAGIELRSLEPAGGQAPRRVLLSELPQLEVEREDLQYGRRTRFRGVPLEALLERLPGSPTDLVLLHFENAMVVPLPTGDGRVLERLSPFVATQRWDAQERRWTSLPAAPKLAAEERDRRPIRFGGNKLVVRSRWHPLVPEGAEPASSPWLHVDTLVAIERVRAESWNGQFPGAATPDERRGRELFFQRCQYCHGARGVGAMFGWDFVEPLPLHTYRSPEGLFLHVRYQPGDAPDRGLMMPAFTDLTPADGRALWEWLRVLGQRPMRPYGAPESLPRR